MERLSAQALSIGYAPPRRARVVVAAGLSVSLRAGELVCLLGPNGAGKSTLMRTLAGMQPPLEGAVRLGGRNLHALPPAERARAVSIVLTDRVDAGHLSVRSLVALGRYPHTNWAGTLTPADHAAVDRAIRSVGAENLSGRFASELSDGERQKATIARALAQDTDVILLDEPTAFLDLPRRVETMALLHALATATGKAVLLSTHDLDLALRSADRLWLMSEGRLRCGIPEDLVLSGAFARAFEREGIRFDADIGAFRVAGRHGKRIAVDGSGSVAAWTARALERIGYEVVPSPAGRRVAVRPDREGWEYSDEHGSTPYRTLEALLAALSARTRPAPDPNPEPGT